MARRMENYEQGYDDRRFEGPVRQDLLCSICHGVLRDPRTCQNKEHPFCLSCISQHLRNSHTCPECREHLTPETLKDPPRFLKNILSELKVKCEYNERGCPGYVLLGNLQNHVDRCGFAPVMCGNEGCGTVVNKRDKEIHERDFCQFRIPKCHDCRDIKARQDEIKVQIIGIERKQDQIKENVDGMKARQYEMKVKITAVERKEDQIKESIDEMKQSQAEMKARQDEMKVELNRTKLQLNGMERKQDQMKQSVDEMRQQFEKMMVMVNQAMQGRNLNDNRAQAIDPAIPSNNQDIIILGGWYGPGNNEISNTVENFNIVEGMSTYLPSLNHPRAESASCVSNNDVYIAGGYDGQAGTDTIEVLKMNQHPLRWMMFGGKLPVKLFAHVVIVHQEKLFIIGGDAQKEERKISDGIYEVCLTPPYTSKLLARMPQRRRNHRAELVNGKLFILGGTTTGFSENAIDNVVAYDLIKNEFKPCAPLPQPVHRMSTVTWGNMILVIGGSDKNGQNLSDVILYDTETGQSERLPSLRHKRRGCFAVMIHDVIVVMGGRHGEQGCLSSVESYTMGSDQWRRKLPGMTEKRRYATAVVKPCN